MKIFHETEDTIMGIVVGLLLLVQVPMYDTVLTICLLLLLLLNILDIMHCMKEFREYVKACAIAIVMNAIDVVIVLSMLSDFYSLNVPLIPVTFVAQNTMVIAVYLIAGNLLYFFLHKRLE